MKIPIRGRIKSVSVWVYRGFREGVEWFDYIPEPQIDTKGDFIEVPDNYMVQIEYEDGDIELWDRGRLSYKRSEWLKTRGHNIL